MSPRRRPSFLTLGAPATTRTSVTRRTGPSRPAGRSGEVAGGGDVGGRRGKNILGRLLPGHVELRTDLAPDLRWVLADPGQVDQVIVNLAVNARDAMLDGAKVTVETRNIEIDATSAESHPWVQPGSYLLMSVSDTGVGMQPEILRRLFEPFFTTKEPGKGTGLGLSTVYGIVKQSNGHIEVDSTPGGGTTFTILLPQAESPARHEE